MTPVEPTMPLSGTLQAQEWNQIINILYDRPYREVASLINKITEQVQAAAGQATPQPLANGADSHVRD